MSMCIFAPLETLVKDLNLQFTIGSLKMTPGREGGGEMDPDIKKKALWRSFYNG